MVRLTGIILEKSKFEQWTVAMTEKQIEMRNGRGRTVELTSTTDD